MKNKRPVPAYVGILFGVLAIVEIILLIIQIKSITEVNLIITNAFAALACVAAFVYYLSGFKKSSAAYFKAFLGLYALSYCMQIFYYFEIVTAAHADTGAGTIVFLALSIISFLILCIFFAGRDLGAAPSYGLAGTLFICNAINMILAVNGQVVALISLIIELIIPILLLLVVIFKYKDKEDRGSEDRKQEKILPTWVSVIIAILCFGLIGYNIYSVTGNAQATAIDTVQAILYCLTCLWALIYCEMGFKKEAAKFFKLFCIMYAATFAFSAVVVIFNMFETGDTRYYIARLGVSLFVIVVALVFARAKDLGKKTGHIFAGLAFLCTGADAFLVIDRSAVFTWPLLLELVLPVVLIISVVAKYRDKDARGTI